MYAIIREDQNGHGFIDVSIEGIFRTIEDANGFLNSAVADAIEDGLRVAANGPSPDWDVSWKIETHSLE